MNVMLKCRYCEVSARCFFQRQVALLYFGICSHALPESFLPKETELYDCHSENQNRLYSAKGHKRCEHIGSQSAKARNIRKGTGIYHL